MSETKEQPDCPVVDFHDERLDMAYWYPTLETLDVPTPETHALQLEPSDDGPPEWDTDLACALVEDLGGEAFLRSGYKSAQIHHSGSHILSSDPEQIDETIAELLMQHVMMQMPHGEALWIREWLDIDFCAYAADPLVPEVRAFVRDGDVVCHHPRLEGFDRAPGGDELKETAESFIESGWNGEHRDETVREYAEIVAEAFDGWWSVDFVMTTSGDWYCTDMALDGLYDGESRGRSGWPNLSEHASGCEYNLEEQHRRN